MKTIEERLDFLEETTIIQNDNIIKTNDHILDLVNNDSEIWDKINENDKWCTDQLYWLADVVEKLAEKSNKQSKRIAELEKIIKENNV